MNKCTCRFYGGVEFDHDSLNCYAILFYETFVWFLDHSERIYIWKVFHILSKCLSKHTYTANWSLNKIYLFSMKYVPCNIAQHLIILRICIYFVIRLKIAPKPHRHQLMCWSYHNVRNCTPIYSQYLLYIHYEEFDFSKWMYLWGKNRF